MVQAMLRNVSMLLVTAALLGSAAHSDEDPAMREKPSHDTELVFVDGPSAADTPALGSWLRSHEGTARQLRLPVRLPNAVGGQREGRVGTIVIAVSDTALGVSLADRVRSACRDATECQVWLEGYWSGTELELRRVGPEVGEPSPHVGLQVDRRTGRAVNAKAGAALQSASDEVIYLDGLSAWPAGVVGRRVEVSGLLVARKLIPDPAVGAGGAIGAGAPGSQTVFESPLWSVVE